MDATGCGSVCPDVCPRLASIVAQVLAGECNLPDSSVLTYHFSPRLFVLVVPPCGLFQANTFQCILTTDGERSFALLRFGEMYWGPGQRIHHDALTGYTDGGAHFFNETTDPTNLFGPGGRYRPQEVKGNTGQLGQLVYDLTGPTEREQDPKMRCQVWALKEPEPKEWAKGVSSCPCTRAQALEDLAFGPETLPPNQQDRVRVTELRGLRWGGSGGHVFQSILSNQHGSGKRCVYDPQGPLLAGYSERYFSGATAQKHIGTVSVTSYSESSTCHSGCCSNQ